MDKINCRTIENPAGLSRVANKSLCYEHLSRLYDKGKVQTECVKGLSDRALCPPSPLLSRMIVCYTFLSSAEERVITPEHENRETSWAPRCQTASSEMGSLAPLKALTVPWGRSGGRRAQLEGGDIGREGKSANFSSTCIIRFGLGIK